ncbi:hypothetical protein FQN54_007293 [Arachnomyces sp. PD_36]|nr:hypothetical protein FQN54_007293 [Arachnomyces sp. PD_36]
MSDHVKEPKNFEPKTPVTLAPPKDDPISITDLAAADGISKPISQTHDAGKDPNGKTYVAIKGTVFDVTGNSAYGPQGQYNGTSTPSGLDPWLEVTTKLTNTFLSDPVFAGKDSSRALATSSLNPEDCKPEWQDLGDKEKTVLEEWYTFFSKRYNIVGKVQGATNL